MHRTVAGGDLLADVFDHRFGVSREQLFEVDQSCGSEVKLEQVADRACHLTETYADVVVQIGGDGAKVRSDHAADDFTLRGGLHPASTRSAAGPRMSKKCDVTSTRDEVLL